MKQRPWLFLLPTLILMSISAFIPLMAVINYSLHTIFAGSTPEFVGLQNYADVMNDSQFRGALFRQLTFSLMALLIEIPLGVGVALCLPRKGGGVGISLVLLGIPLLIPYNVVGIVWRLFTQSDIGVIPRVLSIFGYEYNVSLDATDAFLTILLVDVWHWTPLVALLAYAGLQAIPQTFYQAAEVDGASTWKTFRYVTLPKLRSVLTLGLLIRFMDSFKVYSEPLLLTGGGPGNATTFMSLFVARKAEAYELGYAGASSIIYLYVVIVMSYILFQFINRPPEGKRA
ncbi:MAG: sugar ABC transporter permease [Opitutales bacterium]|jgi:glycerol transport system permease protein|nr:sugar ABC transporter permease [Opitutales bacterium]